MHGEEQKNPPTKGVEILKKFVASYKRHKLSFKHPVEVACFDRNFIIQTFLIPRLTASLDDRRTSSSCELHSVLDDSLQLVLGSFRQIYHQ